MTGSPRRIKILAGGGSLPREIAESAMARGSEVHIVAIDGEADTDFGAVAVTRVNWGQIGHLIQALKGPATDALVIVGSVHRPELWGLKADLGFFLNLPAIIKIVASGGDDSVLRRVVRFFEQQGLTVVGPGDVAPELVIGTGALGTTEATNEDQSDIALGFKVIRALGAYDIGQSVVVSGGTIEAIEGAEGTDRMIERATLRRAGQTQDQVQNTERAEPSIRGVMVKRSKPGQDLRVDMPAIGPETVARAAAAGLRGIAVEAGSVIVAKRAETIARADRAKIFVSGVPDTAAAEAAPRFKPSRARDLFKRLGAEKPEPHHIGDAEKGVAVIRALLPLAAGRSAVVVRNHVIAVEAGEGTLAVIERASKLRQWASLTRRRRGVAVLASPHDLSPAVIKSVEAAGYAGVAVLEADYALANFRQALEAADKTGLFVLVDTSRSGGKA